MSNDAPVQDWATDFNILDADYGKDPTGVWKDLRGRCPIAHSDRYGGSFLPTKFEDVQALSKMVPELSSQDPLVIPPPEEIRRSKDFQEYGANSPPITSDPPLHGWTRRLLLPTFSPRAVEKHREFTEKRCNELIDRFIDRGTADAAGEYAQQIPPAVIAHLLGLPEDMTDTFTQWVRNVLEFGFFDPALRIEYRDIIRNYFREVVAERANNLGDDLISELLRQTDPDGNPVDHELIVGMCNLQLIAGIDTTWSSIGSALWHLGTYAEDRRRLASDADLYPTAIEEFLRVYAPVTMARVVTEEVTYKDVTMCPGDKVIMNFPGANHDEDIFEDADRFIIDRQRNRHVAFGSGIHRCAGSNLARLEMQIAIRTWMERIPEFEVIDDAKVTWAAGQIRGPRLLEVRF